ncbi:Heat shock protein 70 family protein [Dioscorea alata]|uniref:Heat shock protein 70 family protein n=2 Tax=Dioscorea alata TaxID=55571 RepID=A0ACB7UAQ4_DIOAL|nr:Heat shock protein 70 family protein [Dioscorea alata]KAH7657358.1 Heat shock protein 70 family protein [Dioscorea alata]
MSVVGFDVGNENCVVGVARQRGIDIVLNDESKRETPAVVSFGEKQRFIGTAGAASLMRNPKNSVSQIKRLIGRKFSDPDLQRDLQSMPFTVTEGPDGFPLIHVRYLGEQSTFTPTQVLAMVLSNLKSIAEKNLNTAVMDCCIGIPVYFTDLQRRAVMDAAAIAGLHPLQLFHETTATALAYGIYKTDLPENGQRNVAFVDIGHASMQVCIAGFKKGQLKILSHGFDPSLGGRDFDEVLFKHFAAEFKVQYGIDVYQNARACLRLRTACEKLKKVLSANPEAHLSIECLMDEKDVKGFIKREGFERISTPILDRVKAPLEKALAEAGLTLEKIHSVEVVGSGSRVPAIFRILTEFFRKEPRRTMNASECVARGCALQCAILSPTFKVREFQVHDGFPYSIALSWKGSAPDSENVVTDNRQTTIVFPRGNPIPSVKVLTFYRSSTFTVDAMYTNLEDSQVPANISTYTFGPFQSTKGERAKIKMKVRLNIHGIFSVESATMLEVEDVEIPTPSIKESHNESIKMDTDATSKNTSVAESDINMQDAKIDFVDLDVGTESGAPGPEDKPVQMDADGKVYKKKFKRTIVPVVEFVYGGMSAADLQEAVEKEFEMALQDRIMEETKDKKNAVEAYVYEMRNKLHDKYQEFVTTPEKEALAAKLQEVEDWLYDDGEDETKGVYIAKLEELKKQGDFIEERYKENTERGPAVDQLVRCINSYRDALCKDPKFDCIDVAEKQKVINECAAAEAWLREKKQQQDALPNYAEPVLQSADLRRKAEALDRFCAAIMTKPKPAPAKNSSSRETPASQPQQSKEPQPTDDAEVTDQATDAHGQTATAAPSEPMDTNKSDPPNPMAQNK